MFATSRFLVSKRFLPKEIITSDAVFKSISDIKKFESSNSAFRVHGQSISFTEQIPYDIFMIGGFSFDWIITDRLKRILEEQLVTGFVTKKIDWIKIDNKSKCG
ncbi:hypothetical protein [Terrimonas alba]|uniref:hypothetical protein n=1 Tax=Terrimonas alba TaxID=3349636 RepID=UPI0035F487B9